MTFSAPPAYTVTLRAEQLNDDLATLIRQRAGLERALAELVSDTINFAQTAHQGHHTDMPGTWEECSRGVCPGVKRSILRAKAMLEACQP